MNFKRDPAHSYGGDMLAPFHGVKKSQNNTKITILILYCPETIFADDGHSDGKIVES